MSSEFIHLHTHSHYSLLNALPKIDALIEEAKKNEMDALALTDAGNLYGAIEFYKKCKKEEIKPIIGIDAYLSARTRFDKEARVDSSRTRILLLAKNYEGYKNLMKIVSKSYLEGFYYKPRVDYDLLKEHSNNLIAIIPSFSSESTKALQVSDEKKAKKITDWYLETYGKENVYYEITHHPEIEGHTDSQEKIKNFCKKNNIQLVAGQEIYYIYPEDKLAYKTLQKIQSGGEIEKDAYLSEKEADFSFIDEKTIKKFFKDTPEAIKNTKKIANSCNLEIKLGDWIFPDFKIDKNTTYDKKLKERTYKKIPERGLEETKEVTERIEYELKIIKNKGFSPYFLIVADLLDFAKENNILSTTRGSAAGSLVSYLNGITNIDPLKFELPFERFLNPERPKAPDIDMDFADDRRDEVIQYAREKYGEDKVAQIGTFGTMMARGVVRDVARALGYSYDIGDKIAKLIPFGSQGFPMTIDIALDQTPELAEIYKKDKDVKEIIEMAKKIEGCARHISVHAAGVVISPTDITDYTPVQFDPKTTDGKGKLITQFNMHAVEDVGLIKFDFLGIRNLSILADSIKRVEKIHGIKIDTETIPLDDQKTFEMLARGETMGAFQLGGSGMTRYLKELCPSNIHDINAMIALYRPGPMESIPSYIERKHNPHMINYLDPRLKDILYMSHGVITYQDDVLLIAIKLAGYSWLEVDDLRKAMGKKIPEKMKKHRKKLFDGFVKNGMTEQKADQMWRLIEPFAAYGFNKCLTGDTELFNAETGERKTIEEIFKEKNNFKIHSLNEHKKLETRDVENILQNGVKKTFKIKTRSGKEIKATKEHRFYTISGWKKLKDLNKKERIATTREIPLHKKQKNIEPYKVATLGYLLSEGNLCHPHGVYFYSSKEDELKDFIKYSSKFNNSKITVNKDKSATSIYIGQKEKKVGNEMFKWLEKLGLKQKKATQKFIPSKIFMSNNKILAILIGKMWQGDGCIDIKNTQLFYSTSSKKLACDMQYALLRLRIFSTIHKKSFKYKDKSKTGYTINISHRENIKKFKEKIGPHLIGDKFKKMENLYSKTKHSFKNPHLARGTKDIIPSEILKTIRKEMALKKITISSLVKNTRMSKRLFSKDSKKNRIPKRVLANNWISDKI